MQVHVTTSFARVLRWSLYLSQFEYQLTFCGTMHAQTLTRYLVYHFHILPISHNLKIVRLCQHLDDSPLTAKHIQKGKDILLSMIAQYVLQGWPNSVDSQPALRLFIECKLELSVHQNCILWGSRVVIPEKYRKHMLS